MKKIYSTEAVVRSAVLVGVVLGRESDSITKEHLEELEALATTSGLVVVDRFVQKLDRPFPSTWIGKGKVEEIGIFIKEHEVDVVVFDDDLTPSQLRNLEKAWQCKVMDRSLLILEIFAMRARTVQAKTQVELAQYQYLLPRLTRMWTHLSKQRGGAGMKGPGEKELETDRRIAQRKIHLLKNKLAEIERQSNVQRKQRKKYVNVALVGYTNAGKSTLMKSLSKEDVLIEDKLFATLSTTVRKVVLQDIPFLLADTVGFIRKLPHTLVECFKSTLQEVRDADLLLHVVDSSHPSYTSHIAVVHATLNEIGAGDIPRIIVLNKQDQMVEMGRGSLLTNLDKQGQSVFFAEQIAVFEKKYACPVVYCSAIDRMSLNSLRVLVHRCIRPMHHRIYPNGENFMEDTKAP